MSLNVSLGGFQLLRVPRGNPITARYKALGFASAASRANSRSVSARCSTRRAATRSISAGRCDPTGRSSRPNYETARRPGGAHQPASFEIDVGLAIDLGVVSVDRIAVRLLLDPLGAPELTALGVSVNIPGAFKGRGFLLLGHTPEGHSTMTGELDLTLVPLRLRIAANIKMEQFTADTDEDRRADLDRGRFPGRHPTGQFGAGHFWLSGTSWGQFHPHRRPVRRRSTPRWPGFARRAEIRPIRPSGAARTSTGRLGSARSSERWKAVFFSI